MSTDTSPPNMGSQKSKKASALTVHSMDGMRTGRWSKEEHEKFLQAIQLFGKDWKKVEQFVGTRSST